MTQVASIDYPNKRIYLHSDTIAGGFDAILMHFELNTRARLNVDDDQSFGVVSRAEGNLPKGAGKFTPRNVFLTTGWRIVPSDSDHSLVILVETISDDGVSNRDTFDRSLLTPGVAVDIDNGFDQVEIIQVTVSGGDPVAIASAVRVELTPELADIETTLVHSRATNLQTQQETEE